MMGLILAAGYATRLYPLTKNQPKALLEVGGKPMVEHVIDKMVELDVIKKIVIVSNHRFFRAFSKWKKNFSSPTSVELVVVDDGTMSDENRLGAIGDAAFAIQQQKIDEDVLWISGDNLFTFSLHEMHQDFLARKADLISCFDVKTIGEARKFGIVELDANKRVIGFIEKPLQPKSTLASIGIYFYTRKTIGLFQQYLRGGNSPDKPGEFVEWLHKKKPVFGFVFDKPDDEWFDIGSVETLELVRQKFA